MEELTISEMQEMMSAGGITSRELVRLYLERIDTLDSTGPRLNSVIELNADALEEAAARDRERGDGSVRGPLHGIPILLKDNIETADKMTTTAGSLALEGNIAAQDAFLAARLREAGAVLLGKTNLSEWANFRSTHSVSGWSSRGGQVRNPYALDRSPSGSSSGSAVAVSANLCAAAVGTETDGSIISPAQTNGIVGIKPTLGLVSRAGIIPIAHSQDTAGPMTRTVADAALMLGAMTGVDPRDPATQASQGKAYTDYTSFLKADGLRGARIGVARNFFGHHPRAERLIEDCLELMKSLGAELIDPVKIDSDEKVGPTEIEVLYYEFKDDLNGYLGGLGPDARVHSLEEVIAFNQINAERVMPFFGQEHMLKAQEKGPLSDEDYQKAVETNHRLSREEGIDLILQQHNLDAVVAPSGSPAWLVDFVNGDSPGGGGCTSLPAVSGYPHITVPAGLVSGLPVGISFFGPAYSEPTLLRLAYAFEQASKLRRPPQYMQSCISTF
jgi:amidase